jgi:hypothetical protein
MSQNAKVVLVLGSSLLFALVLVLVALPHLKNRKTVAGPLSRLDATQPQATATWTFAVSGDSRDCGDVIMPVIAADVASHAPQFYWHLGDFRFIALVDEDMQCKLTPEPRRPAHEKPKAKNLQEFAAYEERESGKVHEWLSYEKHAWEDFKQYQVGAFAKNKTPVFLGIGNHEMILHNDHKDFIKAFKDWLNPDTQLAETGNIHTYYHWMIGGVDFINLDNAGTALKEKDLSFGDDQLQWLGDELAKDARNADVKTIVVGMHAALSDSISAKHSMNESPEGAASGEKAYQALWNWQTQTHKHVYVLASHSHFYMENIFNTAAWKGKNEVLQGWIVGSAGAHRNPLPSGAGGWTDAKDARTNVYGYLLGTVNPDGQSDSSIKFEFHEVKMDSVPADVVARFHKDFVPWCFQHNTDCVDSDQHCEKSVPPHYGLAEYNAAIAPLHCN